MPELKTVTIAGSRFYEHPVTGSQVPGVTTVIDTLSKPALPRWAAKETATFAVANRKSWEGLDDAAAIDLLKGAPWRMSGGVPACTSVFLGKIGTSASTNFLNDRIRAAALYTTRLVS